jgi:transcriptional regulator with XRE-family HTH domain
MPKKRHPVHAAFAENIRVLRWQRGWTQEQFARKAGIHRTYVANAERGARNTSLTMLSKMARGFKISISELTKGI